MDHSRTYRRASYIYAARCQHLIQTAKVLMIYVRSRTLPFGQKGIGSHSSCLGTERYASVHGLDSQSWK